MEEWEGVSMSNLYSISIDKARDASSLRFPFD